MSDERWARLRDLFDRVRDLSPSEREAVLDRETADDPPLRAEVERILAADGSADRFLSPRGDPVPQGTIGPYHLLEILGEGGFGMVWLAEQRDPIRRRVALKLIKPGMDSRQVVARFEAERQALALMDHPGIAQVFEAGTTKTGRPYFVMEHVPGLPITAFCDRERLPLPERLELFAAVCDAVQHAHQKGVIHRDLKPSNVIVSRRDGVPAPKVIDFGVVKATTPAEGGTLLTREGTIVGTLGYMSPEQAGAVAGSVDTRSDIYSLGVLLYELLAGATPFDPERLRSSPLSEALRIVRDEDPQPLAERLSRSEEDLAAAAERRSTDPRRLVRDLGGELQWITLRALEKDPDRRYASAAELAADVRRHLANEPVLAGAPSTIYRLRKLARRHRVGVAAAAVVLVAIVTGGVAAAVGFGRAVRAERTARAEAKAAGQVSDFLVELFQASTPDRSRGATVTAQDLLAQGTRSIEADESSDPLVRTRLLTALGDSHMRLGDYPEGLRLLREAVATSDSIRPAAASARATQLLALAQGLKVADRPDSIPALVDGAIDLLRRSGDRGSNVLAQGLYRKGQWLFDAGQVAPAESLISIAAGMAESSPERDLKLLEMIHATRAYIANRQFRLDEAEHEALAALQFAKEAGNMPTSEVALHRRLAGIYTAWRRPDDAIVHAEEALRLARKIFPPGHRDLLSAMGGLAEALALRGDMKQAVALREEALKVERTSGVPDDVADELNNLAILHRAMGDAEPAAKETEEAYSIRLKTTGPDNPRTVELLTNLANCYAALGRTAAADSAFAAAVASFDRIGDRTIYRPWASLNYANLCRDAGNAAKAESLYLRTEAELDSTRAGEGVYLSECLCAHALLHARQGRRDDAENMMRTGVQLRREGAADSTDLGPVYVMWAAAEAAEGNADDAWKKLQAAGACGATELDAARYPELAAFRSRPDYPLASSP